MSANEITLNTIYEILKDHTERFDRMDERFDRMDQRFEGVDRRFDGVDKRFDDVDKRFEGVDRRFDGVDKRLDSSDKRAEGFEARLDRFESVQNSIALRLISVETTVKENSVLLRTMQVRLDSLHGLVEELERRTGRIEQEYVMITEALRRLEQRFDRIEADQLKERIIALEARVQALETAQP
jgi:chromosome segregation ATPase